MLHGFESQTQFSSGGRKKKSVYLSWSTNSSHSMSISFQHHNFYGKRPNLKLKFHIAEHFGVLLGIGVENDVNLCYSTVLSALLQKCQISSVINLEMQVPLRVTSPPPPSPSPARHFSSLLNWIQDWFFIWLFIHLEGYKTVVPWWWNRSQHDSSKQ